MHEPINVKSPNNISEWQMGFNSAFKGLIPFNRFVSEGNKMFQLMFSIIYALFKKTVSKFPIYSYFSVPYGQYKK